MPTEAQILAELEDSIEDLEHASGLAKICIYGDSGVGKTAQTVMLAQRVVPPDKDILYIDSFEGWVTLQNHEGTRKRMKRIRWQNLTHAEYLVKAIKKKAGKFANVGGIIWDEFSSMANQDLDVVLEVRAKNDKNKDPDVASQPDMGANTERMRRLLWQILDLDVHLFFVAHRRIDEDDAKVKVISPDFMPKLNKRFREPMHVVAHAVTNIKTTGDKEVVEYILQVHPTRRVVAKSRVGGLDRQVTWEVFSDTVVNWLNRGSQLAPEQEPVSDPVAGNVSDSSSDTDEFTGIEVN